MLQLQKGILGILRFFPKNGKITPPKIDFRLGIFIEKKKKNNGGKFCILLNLTRKPLTFGNFILESDNLEEVVYFTLLSSKRELFLSIHVLWPSKPKFDIHFRRRVQKTLIIRKNNELFPDDRGFPVPANGNGYRI